MRQDIQGLKNHDDFLKLREYAMEAPEGAWTGRLDYQAWGNSQNLFCYFTDTLSGKKYRLSVFNRTKYSPLKAGPPFDEEPVGGVFEITVGRSKNGLATFVSARKIAEAPAPRTPDMTYHPPDILLSDYPEDETEVLKVFHELTGVAMDRIFFEDGKEWSGSSPPVLTVEMALLVSDELPYGLAVYGDMTILDKDNWLLIAARELSSRWRIKTLVELSEARDKLEVTFDNGAGFRCERGYFEETGMIKALEPFEWGQLKK